MKWFTKQNMAKWCCLKDKVSVGFWGKKKGTEHRFTSRSLRRLHSFSKNKTFEWVFCVFGASAQVSCKFHGFPMDSSTMNSILSIQWTSHHGNVKHQTGGSKYIRDIHQNDQKFLHTLACRCSRFKYLLSFGNFIHVPGLQITSHEFCQMSDIWLCLSLGPARSTVRAVGFSLFSPLFVSTCCPGTSQLLMVTSVATHPGIYPKPERGILGLTNWDG